MRPQTFAQARKFSRLANAHEEGTAKLVVAGLIMGIIPSCTCERHTLEQELHADAIASRN